MNMTYAQAKLKASALKELGETNIYLDRESEFPWHIATSCEPGGSHRLEIHTSVWFRGKDPETGLDFRWSFDIEPSSADGKGSYQIDAEACQRVIKSLKGECKTQFRKYLADCAAKVRAKGVEWKNIADKQLADAAILGDLAVTK